MDKVVLRGTDGEGCQSCGSGAVELATVCVEKGETASWSSPGYDATFEEWCLACVKSKKHCGVVRDGDDRQRGDDDGVEYGDPRDQTEGGGQ